MLRYRVNTYSESYKRVANCTAHVRCKSSPAYQIYKPNRIKRKNRQLLLTILRDHRSGYTRLLRPEYKIIISHIMRECKRQREK